LAKVKRGEDRTHQVIWQERLSNERQLAGAFGLNHLIRIAGHQKDLDIGGQRQDTVCHFEPAHEWHHYIAHHQDDVVLGRNERLQAGRAVLSHYDPKSKIGYHHAGRPKYGLFVVDDKNDIFGLRIGHLYDYYRL
jgi:hypothetical protein